MIKIKYNSKKDVEKVCVLDMKVGQVGIVVSSDSCPMDIGRLVLCVGDVQKPDCPSIYKRWVEINNSPVNLGDQCSFIWDEKDLDDDFSSVYVQLVDITINVEV